MPPRRYGGRKRLSAPESRRVTCRIERLGHQGDGIARIGGRTVYIPFALPGETIEADVAGERGELVAVVEPSADRAEPVCPHFTSCGGCSVQHLSPEAYRDWKRGIVVTALRNRGIEAGVGALVDAHGAGRRRVTVHARGNVAGFNRRRGRAIVDIGHCPVLSPDLDRVWPIAREVAGALRATRGTLHVRTTSTDAGLDLDIVGSEAPDLEVREALAAIAVSHDLARLTLEGETVAERRRPSIVMGQSAMTPPARGFLQATSAAEAALGDLVRRAVPAGAKVADLFCGVGPFTLRLAGDAPVLAVDNDPAAISALDRAVRLSEGLKPVEAVRRDLFDDPLRPGELAGIGCVIFDPPRAGAEAQARALAGSDVPVVIGVSCNAATFARDAEILIAGGYRLGEVTPVDQFRYAAHVEMVGVFRLSREP